MYIVFVLKYLTQLRIMSTMEKSSTSGGWSWLYFLNNMIHVRCQCLKL